jgi:hypothetical protein
VITILHEQGVSTHPGASAEGDRLWLTAAEIEAATAWHWKPEGLCHEDVCVPVPPASRADLVRGAPGPEARLDIAAMWRRSGQPVAHDSAGRTWVLGSGAAQRGAVLSTLQAPDFTLPDLEGRPHRLSDLRGRKVFLATWASW